MSAREEHIAIARTARIYLVGEARAVEDLWIVCHGYAQLARKFVRSFEGLLAPGRVIVAPEGLHRFYIDPPPVPAEQRRVGATWMTREDREADIRDYVAYLDEVVSYVAGTDRHVRIRALGFSQGCATVFRWATMGATRLDDLILWSGGVPPDADLDAAAARLRTTRIMVVLGTRDELALRGIAQHDIGRLEAVGLTAELREFRGGHELDQSMLETVGETSLYRPA